MEGKETYYGRKRDLHDVQVRGHAHAHRVDGLIQQ
jgi:hypothetical protein